MPARLTPLALRPQCTLSRVHIGIGEYHPARQERARERDGVEMPSRRKQHAVAPPQPAPVESAEDAAAAYARDGLFWMQNVLTGEQLAALQAAAAESFNQILRGLMTQLMSADPGPSGSADPSGSAGPSGSADPSGSSAPPPVRYAEVVARDGARFDCRHGMDLLPLASLLRPGGLAGALVPLLRQVLGEDAEVCQVGQIIAMTEEEWEIIHEETETFADQKWHTDGRNSANDTDALTVFIPLVDVTLTNGATEFVLGSHAESSGGAQNDDERSALATSLLVPAGSAIAFDYRTCAACTRPAPPPAPPPFYLERRAATARPAGPVTPRRPHAQVAPRVTQLRRGEPACALRHRGPACVARRAQGAAVPGRRLGLPLRRRGGAAAPGLELACRRAGGAGGRGDPPAPAERGASRPAGQP